MGRGTYSASCLEMRFPEYRLSATSATRGSEFRLATAVTQPSLGEERGQRGEPSPWGGGGVQSRSEIQVLENQ